LPEGLDGPEGLSLPSLPVTPERLFEAARSGDQAALRIALVELRPAIEEQVRRTLRRPGNARLLRQCRLEEDDVVQHVLERLLSTPPTNEDGRDPDAALRAWARTVAMNRLLHLWKQKRTHDAPLPEEAQAAAPDRSDAVFYERALRQLVECGERHNNERYRRTARLLLSDPGVSGVELLVELGEVARDDVDRMAREGAPGELMKAQQRGWALRCNTIKALVRCMEEHGYALSSLVSEAA
jgi:DNA-directed RNA polymerase specialized sigma24 family protein